MSAICGIIHFDGKPVEKSDLEIMVESSPHRGPDGTRYHFDGNAGFAHLAFHVTPESVYEKQPLRSPDGRLTLIADVRLDNRRELANALDIRGSHLVELTDPDLLLRAYQSWGERCTEFLLGDFAFAVWDRREHQLFLARDAMGVYGLCYHYCGNSFVFSSEIASILDLPSVSAEINQDAVAKTLAVMPLAPEEAYFTAVRHLKPAHCLVASERGVRTRRYWDIDPEYQVRYRNDEEYTDHFLDLLGDAVACRARTDHPVGISLSGGYDSTLLAAVAASQLASRGDRLHSFSYVFDKYADCDERYWIDPVVERYGIDARFVVADKLWTFVDLEHQPVPLDFLWSNAFFRLPEAMARCAGETGCRVLLSGTFGDALFSEPSLFAADLLNRFQLGTLYRVVRDHWGGVEWRREILHRGLRPLAPDWLKKAYRRFKPTDPAALFPSLAESWLERITELSDHNSIHRPPRGLSVGQIRRYYRMFNSSWAQGSVAVRSHPYNRFTVERCVPYSDRRLVDFVLAIPTERLSHPGRPRRLQNDAMSRLLPATVSRRRGKTGFQSLFWAGVVEKELQSVSQLAKQSRIERGGWVRKGWLADQLRRAPHLPDDPMFLSSALHAELWLRAVEPALNGKARWSGPGYIQ